MQVSEVIHPQDQMYTGNMTRYLSVGRNAMNSINTILSLTGVQPKHILDYACGCGRVCRHLRADYPEAKIVASDIMPHGIQFCADTFSATPHLASPNMKSVSFGQGFDLIWSGSLITHIDESKALAMIDMMIRSLNDNGVAIWSQHGRYVERFEAKGKWPYKLSPPAMANLAAQYRAGKYAYTDYEHMRGYGISITPMNWLFDAIAQHKSVRFVGLVERGWDNHQDVVAIQKKPIDD